MEPIPKTKAETLARLAETLPEVTVPPLFYFTAGDWTTDPEAVLRRVQDTLNAPVLVVRSSSQNEDSESESKAGYYKTVLDVPADDPSSIRSAVEEVLQSYDRDAGGTGEDQVLVQEQVGDVDLSGVLFSRGLGNNLPYYVLNYTRGEDTSSVTSGRSAQMRIVHHVRAADEPAPWRDLLATVYRIESLWEGPLDIEFVIDRKGRHHIVQARPLAANAGLPAPEATTHFGKIEAMARRFGRYHLSAPHLAGGRTIFSDMADWNPSEIIGDRPNSLAYSLYRYIITDEIWHLARTQMGYYDASPGQLMVSFGRKPYIDVRLSFNSLTPAGIADALREKLVDHYLDRLEAEPHLHDKVEHDILFTCYDFSLPRRLKALHACGFDHGETEGLRDTLLRLTNSIIRGADAFFEEADEHCRSMARRRARAADALDDNPEPWDYFSAAYVLLSDCRYYGTLPFSKVARMGFIAKQFLLSLEDELSPGILERFSAEISTVTSQFRDDCNAMRSGRLSDDDFFEAYGHLRPSTYDITAPRYDEMPAIFTERTAFASTAQHPTGGITEAERSAIDGMMKKHGLEGGHERLFDFISRSTTYREWLKFEFTKNLSLALKFLAQAGALLNVSREELARLTLADLMRLRNPEDTDITRAGEALKTKAEERKRQHEAASEALLPPLLCRPSDFWAFEIGASKPNYVSSQSVEAPLCLLERIAVDSAPGIDGAIVLIENADPGYDWIFNHDLRGLITKYGGASSHMAIRCGELRLPAAIGCGEVVFESLKTATHVRLDCASGYLEPMGTQV